MRKGKNKDFGAVLYFRDSLNLRKKWPLFLCIGILLIILGVLAIIYAGWATVLTIELLGFFLLAGGVLLLVNAFQAKEWQGVSLSILLGLLNIVVGAICIFKPLVAASGITLLLAAFFFVGGLFRMISALAYRFDFSWLWFLNGLIAFILGILIVTEWPSASLWIIGIFIGIDLIINGCNWVAISLAAKCQ
jgi:uncharacterized membrane protein HdeD (DUF308 family)